MNPEEEEPGMYWDWARAEIGAIADTASISAATGAALHRAPGSSNESFMLFTFPFVIAVKMRTAYLSKGVTIDATKS